MKVGASKDEPSMDIRLMTPCTNHIGVHGTNVRQPLPAVGGSPRPPSERGGSGRSPAAQPLRYAPGEFSLPHPSPKGKRKPAKPANSSLGARCAEMRTPGARSRVTVNPARAE